YQLRKARSSWLNLLSISGTFNEQTFAKDDPSGPTTYVFPRYNFGVSVPLGIIFSKGLDIKSAKAGVELSKNNQTQLVRNIKADILSKYRQYRNLEARILAQSLVVDDEEAIYLQMKEKFKNGQTSFELHNVASKSYNNEIEKKMNLEMQKDLLEFEIERIIGVELESIIR
ncbi:MAG: TolC family protein, partial [Flavisolibacter sp.]